MKSILVGIYFAASALSAVGPSFLSVAATENTQETKRRTRTRRLRRNNVVKVDGIDEADAEPERKNQQAEAVESINRIVNRSDDKDESISGTNREGDNRQLMDAGKISRINVSSIKNKNVLDDEDVYYLMNHVLEPTNRNFYSYSIPAKPVSLGGIVSIILRRFIRSKKIILEDNSDFS